MTLQNSNLGNMGYIIYWHSYIFTSFGVSQSAMIFIIGRFAPCFSVPMIIRLSFAHNLFVLFTHRDNSGIHVQEHDIMHHCTRIEHNTMVAK